MQGTGSRFMRGISSRFIRVKEYANQQRGMREPRGGEANIQPVGWGCLRFKQRQHAKTANNGLALKPKKHIFAAGKWVHLLKISLIWRTSDYIREPLHPSDGQSPCHLVSKKIKSPILKQPKVIKIDISQDD